MIGLSEIIVVTAVGVILFNLKRLPDLAKAMKDSGKIFKKSLHGEEDSRPTRDLNGHDPNQD